MTTAERVEAQALTDKQREWIDGLRAMADFCEANPEVLSAYPLGLTFFSGIPAEVASPKAHMAYLARLMAPCDKAVKDYDPEKFQLRKHFGPHDVVKFTARENVCERRVVGTEEVEVEGYTDEAQAVLDSLPTVTRTETREIVEWICPPSLLGAS